MLRANAGGDTHSTRRHHKVWTEAADRTLCRKEKITQLGFLARGLRTRRSATNCRSPGSGLADRLLAPELIQPGRSHRGLSLRAVTDAARVQHIVGLAAVCVGVNRDRVGLGTLDR